MIFYQGSHMSNTTKCRASDFHTLTSRSIPVILEGQFLARTSAPFSSAVPGLDALTPNAPWAQLSPIRCLLVALRASNQYFALTRVALSLSFTVQRCSASFLQRAHVSPQMRLFSPNSQPHEFFPPNPKPNSSSSRSFPACKAAAFINHTGPWMPR